MFKSLLLGIAFLFATTITLFAQQKNSFFRPKTQIGIATGIINYQGDLVDNTFDITQTKLTYSAFLRREFSSLLSFRIGLDYGTLSGSDKSSTTIPRQQRNLSFNTKIFGGYFGTELTFANFYVGNIIPVKIYGYLGIGVFNFKPRAKYNDEWIELKPLSTEGQGLNPYVTSKPYNLTQLYYPMAFGIKMPISNKLDLGFELKKVLTSTDYIDDVSGNYAAPEILSNSSNPELTKALANRTQELSADFKPSFGRRGNPNNFDGWFTTQLTLTYKFGKKGCTNYF